MSTQPKSPESVPAAQRPFPPWGPYVTESTSGKVEVFGLVPRTPRKREHAEVLLFPQFHAQIFRFHKGIALTPLKQLFSLFHVDG
jgi:hypothetical protein